MGRIKFIQFSFFFLLKVNDSESLKQFMHSLLTRYSVYFNKKYKRVGSLFQDRYKGVLVTEEAYILHLSRYIHLNPLRKNLALANAYSSYLDYLEMRNTSWVKPDLVLAFFKQKSLPTLTKTNNYKDFVEKYKTKAILYANGCSFTDKRGEKADTFKQLQVEKSLNLSP